MFGIEASSSTASGNLYSQILSACAPSSASEISKSSRSRMRLATLRMTLESSTTRQVFMTTPPHVRTEAEFVTKSLRFGSRAGAPSPLLRREDDGVALLADDRLHAAILRQQARVV